jgi:hypothetical protein
MKFVQCKCNSNFQDGSFGKGIRAHNPCTKKGKVGERLGFKCTVCGSIKTI